MKEIIFVQHALDRMKERGITVEQVKTALKCNGINDNRNEKRKIAQRLIEGRLLRVVYEEESGEIIVVSAYCTSRVNKYTRRNE